MLKNDNHHQNLRTNKIEDLDNHYCLTKIYYQNFIRTKEN